MRAPATSPFCSACPICASLLFELLVALLGMLAVKVANAAWAEPRLFDCRACASACSCCCSCAAALLDELDELDELDDWAAFRAPATSPFFSACPICAS